MAYDTSPIPNGYGSLPISTRTGNPYLDEIDQAAGNAHAALSPGAQAALRKAGAPVPISDPQMGRITGPRPAAPTLPIPQESTQPLASSMPSAPTTGIQAPHAAQPIQPVPQTAAAGPAQAEMTRLSQSKAGVDKIHNPWARIPLQILAGVGETFAPRLATALPGTWSHHNMLLGEAENAVAQQQGIRKSEEEARLNAANVGHLGAETEQAQANAESLREGARFTGLVKVGKDGLYDAVHKTWLREPTDAEEGGTVHEEKGGNLVVVHPSGKATLVTMGGQPVQAAPKAGSEAERVLSPDEIAQYNQQLNDRYGLLNKGQKAPAEYQLPAVATQGRYNIIHQSLQQLEAGRQSQQTAATNEGLRREVIANNQAYRTSEEMRRAGDRFDTQMKAELGPVSEQVQNLQEARRLIASGAVGQALGTVKSLVAVAGGKGSGLRITQPELNSIPAARGLPGGFDTLINNLMGSGKITGETQRQLDEVLGQVEEVARRKQELVNGALDRAAQAKSPQDIHKIDTDYRHQIQASTRPQPQQAGGGGGGAVPGVGETFQGGKVLKVTKIK